MTGGLPARPHTEAFRKAGSLRRLSQKRDSLSRPLMAARGN